MQMKQWLYILIFTLLFSACSDNNVKKYVIGVSQCSEDIWRDKLNNELVMSTYQHDNVTLKFASANDNDRLQKQQIEQFIKEGVNLLIVSPNQIHTISSVIDKAYDAGIPVILFDRKTDSKKYTAFIGADNYEAGYEIGNFIGQQLDGKGNIAEICGLQASSPAIERNRGFMDALKDYSGIKVIARKHGDWVKESGVMAMDSVLSQAKEPIQYVFAQNDRMALGALQSIKKHKVKGIRIVGIDALPVPGGGMENVRDGNLEASYIYPTRGDSVMQLALNILEKKPYKRDNYLKGALVTKANANVLLMQNEEMNKQTARLNALHGKVDTYLVQYNHQKMYIVLFSIILFLLIGIMVYIYRTILMKRRIEEDANKAKLQFFTNISHELRTPLTLIADPVNYIMHDDNLNSQQRSMLQIVQRNVLVLTQLVSEILDFRKVQNGKMELRLSDFNLSESMKQWIMLFSASAQKKHIAISMNAPDAVMLRADQDKIERICYNLLSNALKYTSEGGEITLTAKEENGRVMISVADNGCGISSDELPYIFDRFYQAKNAGRGTGIGLAIVKAFTELHHGEVSATSVEGKGSTFTIHIPVRQKGEVTNQPTEKIEQLVEPSSAEEVPNQARHIDELIQPYQTDKPEVLIIDDNIDIRTYLRSVLSEKYNVSEAANGKVGLELARKIVPDIVLSDIMMPVMDGLAFCQQLKTDKAISHIPVILLTARSLDEQRAEGYEHGADAYLSKPFSLRLLFSRIDNLIQSRKKLSKLFSNSDENDAFEKLSNETDKTFAAQLRKIIQDHLSDNEFNVERIGDEIGLSRVQLYRKVKALTGYSPVEMLRKARLTRARHLLRTTEKTVSEVAYAVGFSTPSYFSKCYKDEFGESPKK
ncbi:substrate-binding domain-containing protein [Prevotella melaninogenica]|uniref:substrate-binding domain-containing protein n=1 Tax=Prevotella melaninogenica TaxID=28132 RepID=UPI0001AEB6DE|nr:substrate-binding domain-containing protein [Prevotella melaninogenica]ADK96037.1 ATPase/histidine kinase/DNA gyrase B/HSP90 domain protein [Prevotella melaninogenica ATCC 25845]ASE16752.1 GHKL domain-containing protein [Prevotella melaninogenica]UEB07723.1 substrate-binding domain-containing protein [Prevotella melaninogenica]